MSLAELENGQLAAEIQKVSSVNRLVKIVRSWIPAPVQDDRVASVHVDISDTGGKIPGVDPNLKNVHESGFVFDNRGPFIIAWTALMSLVCFYNLATLTILIFEEVHTVHYSTWLIANASTDFLLLLDIFVQSRTAFYEDGVKIYNSAATREKYASRWEFVVDIGAILPTDLLLFIKHNMSLFRSNRLLKCYRLLDFVNLADMRIQRTSAWSIAKVMITAIFIFHWNACGYYLMSTMLDIDAVNKSDWAFSFDKINDPIFPKCEMSHRVYVCRMNETEEQVDVRDDNTTEGEQHRKKMLAFWSADKFDEERYSNLSKEYVLSMYWSSMTITTLGEQPEPNFSYQNLYEIFDSVVGILLFAVIVGSVGDMVANSNAYTSNLRSQLDGVKLFMKTRQVDYLLQKKALNFFGFMINNRHVDDRPMKKYLPGKLRQAMQMCIHEDMLREVDLFKGSDDRLINELVGKLRLQFYCPHDEICKRGEQGKEMYIVKSGQLLAMSADNETVLFTIPEGCAFGELYLFDLPEHKLKNRRCTTIRSVGFTDLYVLHRDDFSNVLLDFPRTKAQLVKKAKAMLRRDNMFIPRQTASTIPGLLNAITMDEKLAVLERNLDNIGELIIGQQQLIRRGP
ncbi:hypothetical protein QR680_003368 [Steinernema hermaphroditum]|uniref:Cyclic nucleotide-binding domain-containing protein n=1 Tax=Steinernema hermaphroditum TaxID=289476 RepID=A0AA39LJK8_9BILA|nr:hypothetical protein QR680_003368 [Steinernema hermaphroditum]